MSTACSSGDLRTIVLAACANDQEPNVVGARQTVLRPWSQHLEEVLPRCSTCFCRTHEHPKALRAKADAQRCNQMI